jgi:hypothetical protein
MTGYTKGPWRYVRENGSPTTGQHMIAGARPGYLAEVRDCGSGDVSANARLIAAAPDLLEALQMVRDYVVTMKGDGHQYQVVIDEAIAKATGAVVPPYRSNCDE